MKILHITESFGGGVTSAINSYVKNSSQFSHYLFATVRHQDETGEEQTGNFLSKMLVNRSVKSLFLLYKYIKKVKPDIVHLHSTYAGAIVRVLPFISKSKIVYTPHGFSFLRNESVLNKKLYFLIERILSRRTEVIAACGLDEKLIAQKFVHPFKTHEIINVCDEIEYATNHLPNRDRPCFVMVGRVSEQKGYVFFAEVAQKVTGFADMVWIGGGEDNATKLLVESGVKVTGWLERKDVLDHLSNADYYFHSAAWDGFPISVLEAAKMNKPMILRDIGPFSSEGLKTVCSVEQAVEEIKLLMKNDSLTKQRVKSNSEKINERHTKENLQKALNSLYDSFRPSEYELNL
ncbi:glycosyltransferase [Vibrio chagasii]|uniref:glycosyltransferase n=1 Tax=Vibrio chagasii TaxID=170679 RepID=UPI003DA8622C